MAKIKNLDGEFSVKNLSNIYNLIIGKHLMENKIIEYVTYQQKAFNLKFYYINTI